MIAKVLGFLRDQLNHTLPRGVADGAAEDLFVYASAGKEDSVSFRADSVSLLLVRLEEDATLRPADRYAREIGGVPHKVQPEIHMNLYVLFVARFPDDYKQALHHLSRVVGYFQNHRVFNADTTPGLDEAIAQLVVELVAPTFSEQNELWGSLRVAMQPSALYRVRTIAFSDQAARPSPVVREIGQRIKQVTGDRDRP